jgi:hypothetical protein
MLTLVVATGEGRLVTASATEVDVEEIAVGVAVGNPDAAD